MFLNHKHHDPKSSIERLANKTNQQIKLLPDNDTRVSTSDEGRFFVKSNEDNRIAKKCYYGDQYCRLLGEDF